MAIRARQGGWCPLNIRHTAAVEAYEPVKIGDMIVVPQVDAAANTSFAAEILGANAKYEATAAENLVIGDNGAKAYLVTAGGSAGRIGKTTGGTNEFVGYLLVNGNIAAGSDVEVVLAGGGA